MDANKRESAHMDFLSSLPIRGHSRSNLLAVKQLKKRYSELHANNAFVLLMGARSAPRWHCI